MGNSGGKAKDPKVKKRKGQVGKKGNRPVSDPVGYSSTSEEVHGLRRAGSEDIGGSNYYEGDVVSRSELCYSIELIIALYL